eukprot:7547475-Pyramimonas_sp.AAC.1
MRLRMKPKQPHPRGNPLLPLTEVLASPRSIEKDYAHVLAPAVDPTEPAPGSEYSFARPTVASPCMFGHHLSSDGGHGLGARYDRVMRLQRNRVDSLE